MICPQLLGRLEQPFLAASVKGHNFLHSPISFHFKGQIPRGQVDSNLENWLETAHDIDPQLNARAPFTSQV